MDSNALPGKVQSCTVICKSLAFWLRICAMLCPESHVEVHPLQTKVKPTVIPKRHLQKTYSWDMIHLKYVQKMHQTTLKGGGEKSVSFWSGSSVLIIGDIPTSRIRFQQRLDRHPFCLRNPATSEVSQEWSTMLQCIKKKTRQMQPFWKRVKSNGWNGADRVPGQIE